MAKHELTDVQVDALFTALVKAEGCQWIGYEVPRNELARYCGEVAVPGKPYCQCHMAKAYVRGSALRGKKKARAIEKELNELNLREAIAQDEADVEVVEVAVDFG
jgi:hypothetical protein